jgi:hypothetical protein
MLSSPTYTLAAYLWFANNDEGYIMLVIDDGSLGDYKLFHYILNTAQAAAPAPAKPAPQQQAAPQAPRQNALQPVPDNSARQGETQLVITRRRGTSYSKVDINIIIDNKVVLTLPRGEDGCTASVFIASGKHTIYAHPVSGNNRNSNTITFDVNSGAILYFDVNPTTEHPVGNPGGLLDTLLGGNPIIKLIQR